MARSGTTKSKTKPTHIFSLSDSKNSISLCPGLEKTLQDRLRSLVAGQLAGKQDMQEIAETTDDLSRRKQTYRTEAEDIQDLMEDMKFQLDRARANLRAAVRD